MSIDAPVPFENKQDGIVHRLAPVLANKLSQTEHTALNNCACNCGVLTAELEGVKLELVIMQKNFEIKLDSVVSKIAGEHVNIFQLKQDLSREKDKSNRLESDLALFVRERNIEVDELNETIASLHDRIRTVEAINDQLTLSNMCINLETASKSTQLEGKSIEMQTQNDDQNDERCSNNEYHTKPQNKARSVPVANPNKVRSRKKTQQQPDRPKSQQPENLHTKSSNWLNYLPLLEVPSRKQSEEIENKKGKINKENIPSRPGNKCSYTDYHFPTRNYYPPFRKHHGSWHSTHPPSYKDRREDWLNYLVFVRQALRT